MKKLGLMVLSMLVLGAASASAQETDFVPDEAPTIDTKKVGWSPLLKVSANMSFTDNRKVVGQEEGSTWNIGGLLLGELNYVNTGGHAWENGLKWQLGFLRTPSIEEFYKSTDLLDLDSTYLWRPKNLDWLGPFATFRLQTSVFPGYIVRANGTNVYTLDADGNLTETNGVAQGESVEAQKKVDVTSAFSPSILRESLGAFADITKQKKIEVQARLGVGAWEIFGRDGYAALGDDDVKTKLEGKLDVDDNGTAIPVDPARDIVLTPIQDSIQAGGELQFTAKGVLWKDQVNYKALFEIMQPFYNNADTALSGLDLMNIGGELNVGFKLKDWDKVGASLDYSLKVNKYPLIIDEWQVTNALLLTITASVVEEDKKK